MEIFAPTSLGKYEYICLPMCTYTNMCSRETTKFAILGAVYTKPLSLSIQQ